MVISRFESESGASETFSVNLVPLNIVLINFNYIDKIH
jgi:hypothetical protein